MPAAAAALPLTYAAATEPLRRLLQKEPAEITHAKDQGLDRYDFAIPVAAARSILAAQGNDQAQIDVDLQYMPTMIWIDPATHLTQRAIVAGNVTTYTYGGPNIASIYDAGAPRTAKVYDNRPDPQTAAALARMTQRANTPLPDGVSVFVDQQSDDQESGRFYGCMRAVKKTSGYFAITTSNSMTPPPDAFDLPPDWATTGADEFFRRLAISPAVAETIGDDTVVDFRDFTVRPPELPGQNNSGYRAITKYHETGRDAKSDAWISAPTFRLFCLRCLYGQYGTSGHVALLTDAQHPGLINLRLEFRNLTPDSLSAAFDFWLDPAHDDRPVQSTEESFEDYTPTRHTWRLDRLVRPLQISHRIFQLRHPPRRPPIRRHGHHPQLSTRPRRPGPHRHPSPHVPFLPQPHPAAAENSIQAAHSDLP